VQRQRAGGIPDGRECKPADFERLRRSEVQSHALVPKPSAGLILLPAGIDLS